MHRAIMVMHLQFFPLSAKVRVIVTQFGMSSKWYWHKYSCTISTQVTENRWFRMVELNQSELLAQIPNFAQSILALTLGTSASRLISVELLETLCKLSELCTPATWDYKPRHSDVSARQYTPEHWMWSVGDKMLRCAMFWKQQRKFDHLLKRPLVATNHKKRVEIRGHISNVVCTGTYTHMRYGFACWAWVCEEFDEYYVYTNFEYIRPSTRALLLSISSVCFCFLYVHQFKRWVKSNSSGRGVKVCLCGWARAWICPIIFPKTNRIPLSSRQYTKLHSSTHL